LLSIKELSPYSLEVSLYGQGPIGVSLLPLIIDPGLVLVSVTGLD